MEKYIYTKTAVISCLPAMFKLRIWCLCRKNNDTPLPFYNLQSDTLCCTYQTRLFVLMCVLQNYDWIDWWHGSSHLSAGRTNTLMSIILHKKKFYQNDHTLNQYTVYIHGWKVPKDKKKLLLELLHTAPKLCFLLFWKLYWNIF